MRNHNQNGIYLICSLGDKDHQGYILILISRVWFLSICCEITIVSVCYITSKYNSFSLLGKYFMNLNHFCLLFTITIGRKPQYKRLGTAQN